MLILNVKESNCHLDKEVLVSTNNVAMCIGIGGKEFAQKIVIRRFRGAFTHISVLVTVSVRIGKVIESDVSSIRLIDFNCPSIFTYIE